MKDRIAGSPVDTSGNMREPDELENDPRFLLRIEQARASLRSGKGVKLEDIPRPKPRRTGRQVRPR